MKITIISIGKFENSPHKLTFEHYLKRMKWHVELKELEAKISNSMSVEKIKELEYNLIIKSVKSGSKSIILHEKSQEFSSQNFANLIQKFALNGDSHLNFIIGGANGLAPELLQNSDLKISLSQMTFPHLMVRSILLEQLYRAQSIIAGHPYHKE